MSDDTPPLVPEPLPENEEAALIDMAAGMPIQEVCLRYDITEERAADLMHSTDFQDALVLRAAEIHNRSIALANLHQLEVEKNLWMTARDDAELGFKVMKEIGSFRRLAKQMGQEAEKDVSPQVMIQINTFGVDIGQDSGVIDVTGR